MMIKAIFFDIDGTLVSFKTHKIPESTIQALHTLKAKGIKLFIATGRPPYDLKFLIDEFGDLFTGYITFNGQYCYDSTGKILHEEYLNREDLIQFTNYIKDKDIACGFMEIDYFYFNLYNDRLAKLKETLGEHVNQAGSLVTPERLRFDITHFEPISKEELDIVERKVNDVILQSLDIDCEVMGINEAKEKGAMALFGEKYGNEVRVVSMGDYSIELCGGTHLNNTSQVGLFKILSEGGVAAGVRRIEAITGRSVYEYLNNRDELIKETCNALKTKEDNLVHRVNALVEENKSLTKELHDVKAKMSLQSADKLMDSKVEVNGVNLVTAKFEDMDMNSLKEMADNLRDKLQSGVVAISNVSDSKVNFVVTATKDVIDRGIHSGNIVKEIAKIAGGKGGGRPNMAQAGATDATKIDEALSYACEVIKSQVK